MMPYLKPLFLNLVIYTAIWFWMAQVNFFMGWLSISIPIYWIFVFFPVMTMGWIEGLTLTCVFGIFLESQFTEFRGVLIPLFLGLFLYLHHRRVQLFDSNYRVLLWLASLTHFVIVVSMSLVMFLRGQAEVNYLLLRTLQDWFSGQLLLFLFFPVLWFGFMILNGNTRTRAFYSEI
jgi:hypothetical protein